MPNPPEKRPSVRILGTRGYPSYYGGFETAVRKLAPYLVTKGWDVTVYGRPGTTRPNDPLLDTRVQTRLTRGLETRSLSTLSYGLTSSFDTAIHKTDVALVFNVANGFYLPALKARGIPTLVNVDGIEWERAKWSPLGKKVFRAGARLTAKYASGLVFDARAIENYWQENFEATGTFIPYGGDVPDPLPVPNGLSHRGYVLMVARFVPENSVHEFFTAVPSIAANYPVVIVGNSGYGGEFDQIAQDLTREHPSVSWLGHVSDDKLLSALWQHAGVYFHGHSVGGTNPALVQAMASGAPILARDTVYNREVLGPTGHFIDVAASSISSAINSIMTDEYLVTELSKLNYHRAQLHYSWAQVCTDYENALRSLLKSRNYRAK